MNPIKQFLVCMFNVFIFQISVAANYKFTFDRPNGQETALVGYSIINVQLNSPDSSYNLGLFYFKGKV